MARVLELFVSHIYAEDIGGGGGVDIGKTLRAVRDIAAEDRAGQAWSKTHDYAGYTSYASLNDLPDRHPAFADLVGVIDRHVAKFANVVDFDLAGRRLRLDSLWINILSAGGHHTAHIHPHSVVSGTLYLGVPKGASAIKFEDPRLAMLVAAPPRKAQARDKNKTFVTFDPKPGTLLLWESWMRHEVPVNHAKTERVSLSFNYSWGERARG